MNASGSVSVATFNCEWRKTTSTDATLIRERIEASDVVCLTETHVDFISDRDHSIVSEKLEGGPNSHSRRKVLLWSQNPWTRVDTVGPPGLPEGRYV